MFLSILSLQESVKCCHQNKHIFHVVPVCCITAMSQCNPVQTPKKFINRPVTEIQVAAGCVDLLKT